MINAPIIFACHGCGARVDAALLPPFRCPAANEADDIDHLLLPPLFTGAFAESHELNPFLRYRSLLSPYRLARSAGLSDEAWEEIVGTLDAALASVDGTGFVVTPMTRQPALATALGLPVTLWVKDETRNVGGSHKARHLMGLMLYLRVLAAARLPAATGLASRRLAIASCGNAALAAAVIARAANWPLEVFIPPDADAVVVRRLAEFGAAITVCERQPSSAGDPCFLRFREAVQQGAIPFGVQGSENGIAIEAGRTIAFEMAEALALKQLDAVFVQVGGGALASALAQGFALATQVGLCAKTPQFYAVQTEGCAPLARAWRKLGASGKLADAARQRSAYMWPWESPPSSLAHGILDDETYDWLEIVKAMRKSGGDVIVAAEELVVRAHALARAKTDIAVSATGSAGLAGLIAAPQQGEVAVIFSGVER